MYDSYDNYYNNINLIMIFNVHVQSAQQYSVVLFFVIFQR